MRRVLWVLLTCPATGLEAKTSQALACIRPVPLFWLPSLEELLGKIAALCQQCECDVAALLESPNREVVLDLLQKVVDLHPRVDIPSHWGFPVEGLELDRLNKLFAPGGELHALNQVQPSLEADGSEKDPYPPHSTGDLVLDWIVDLTHTFQGNYSQAQQVVADWDVNSVLGFSRRLGDLWLGKEERAKRGAKAWYYEWEKAQGDSWLKEIVGEEDS